MGFTFFTLLQHWINFAIFWQEIIKLFLKIAQFPINVTEEARVNICKFLNELFFILLYNILILTSSQNHIRVKTIFKNNSNFNLKMAEAQNGAYSSAFIWLDMMHLLSGIKQVKPGSHNNK